MSWKSVAGFVGAVGTLVSGARADGPRRTAPPDRTAIGADAGAGVPDGVTFPYRTSFEPSQGFNAGALNGQQGWTTFTATPNQPAVATANARTGAQHLRLVDTPAVPDATLSGGFSPDLGVANGQRSATSVWLSINNVTPGPTGGADYDVVGQETTAGGEISFRVKFQFSGDVVIADDVNHDGTLEFVDSGANWSPNTYNNLRVFHNPASDQIAYFLNRTLIYQSADGVFGGDDVSQVVLTSDNFFVAGESGDYDDLAVFDPVAGDADVNGTVNLDDFNVLAANFGTASGATWIEADFDGNGAVNLDDFNLLAANFGTTATGPGVTPDDWAALGAAVPEPSTLVLLPLTILPLLRRQRRRERNQFGLLNLS
jgi:hypothetical protein